VIDQDNNQVGVVQIDDALNRALEVGLDLVEVAPTSDPPVCRIMDFGKWKYEQKKKDHKAKQKQHNVVLKEVRLRPKIEEHDRMVKLKKAREFLEKGNKVQFMMIFRGREMAHTELALGVFKYFETELVELGKVESPPQRQGRRMHMVMGPANAQ
jgi:translation initiation factor IF-3